FRPSKTLPARSLPEQELDRLPSSYGRTCLVMLAIDPYTIHGYWEVTLEDLAGARNRIPKQKTAQPVLRFYYSGHASPGADPFDVNIDLRSRNWYVPLWSAGKTYYVELGLKAQHEQFVLLARSHIVHS